MCHMDMPSSKGTWEDECLAFQARWLEWLLTSQPKTPTTVFLYKLGERRHTSFANIIQDLDHCYLWIFAKNHCQTSWQSEITVDSKIWPPPPWALLRCVSKRSRSQNHLEYLLCRSTHAFGCPQKPNSTGLEIQSETYILKWYTSRFFLSNKFEDYWPKRYFWLALLWL